MRQVEVRSGEFGFVLAPSSPDAATKWIPDVDQLLLWACSQGEPSMQPLDLEGIRSLDTTETCIGLHILLYPSNRTNSNRTNIQFQCNLDLRGVENPLITERVRLGNGSGCSAEVRVYLLPGKNADPLQSALATAEACRLGDSLKSSDTRIFLRKVLGCQLHGRLRSFSEAFVSSRGSFQFTNIDMYCRSALHYLGRALCPVRGRGRKKLNDDSIDAKKDAYKPEEPQLKMMKDVQSAASVTRIPQLQPHIDIARSTKLDQELDRDSQSNKILKALSLDLSGVENVNGLETKIRRFARFENDCTEVSEGLYVAGESVARDREVLERIGITHILNCARDVVPNCFSSRFEYLSLYLRDSADEDLAAVLPESLAFIDKALRVPKGKHAHTTNGKKKKNRVLVHCHQGVSRSCSIAIAYLMYRDNSEYDETYRKVKQRRRVCRPNLKFTCDLLAFGTRRAGCGPNQNSANNTLFRVSFHARCKSDLLVCRQLSSASSSALDERGVFLLQPPMGSLDKVLIWIGPKCQPALRGRFVECAKKHAQYLREVERCELASRIEIIEDGEMFLSLLDSNSSINGNGVGTRGDYDCDYMHSPTESVRTESVCMNGIGQAEMRLESKSEFGRAMEVEDIKLAWGSEKRVSLEETTTIELRDSESDSDLDIADVTLHGYPGFQNLPSFSSEDFLSSNAYVLFVRHIDSQQVLHVWIGDGFEIPVRFGNDADEFAQHVASGMRDSVSAVNEEAKVVVEWEDAESEEFLDLVDGSEDDDEDYSS